MSKNVAPSELARSKEAVGSRSYYQSLVELVTARNPVVSWKIYWGQCMRVYAVDAALGV